MPTPAPKAKGKAAPKDLHRRSRSRNSTPMSQSSLSAIDPAHSPYLTTSLGANNVLSNTPVEDLFDGNGSTSYPPSATLLRGITEGVKNNLLAALKPRTEICERLMRELNSKQKERKERNRLRELELQAEAEAERRKNNTVTPKKRAREDEEASSRPLAVGAHGVARQDGGNSHGQRAGSSSSISSPMSQLPQSPATADRQKREGSRAETAEPHQPPPAPAIPQYQIFGDDPTQYPDDTIYEIREVTPGMSDEEKKEIYSVAHFPESDLHDRTAGTPPDRDFSNAKPAQQINFSTFQNYAEPFIRPLTEEDRGFLLERGNREAPFVIPKLGAKHWTAVFAEEDGDNSFIDTSFDKLNPNEPRGGIELMDDSQAEGQYLSLAPALSRLVTAFRGEFKFRGHEKEEDVVLPGIDNMEVDGETNGLAEEKPEPSATQFPEPYWKTLQIPPPNQETIDDRIQRELVYMGMVSPSDSPDFNSRLDDEISARLRYLQTELRRVSIKNGARKQRLLELTEDYMAKSEYSTIADDLDNQINAAYLKRNRNISKKGKQQKRPGGAGGGSHVVGVAQRAGQSGGVGEPIKSLIERKTRWANWIGPTVDYGKTRIPGESIFKPEVLMQFEAREQDAWGEDPEA